TEVLAGTDGPSDLHAFEIEYLLQCAEGRVAQFRAVELIGDDAPGVQGEHRQMSQVPPGEGQIDRLGEICEGVRRAEREGSPRARPQTLTAPSEQFDSDGQPCLRHAFQYERRLRPSARPRSPRPLVVPPGPGLSCRRRPGPI